MLKYARAVYSLKKRLLRAIFPAVLGGLFILWSVTFVIGISLLLHVLTRIFLPKIQPTNYSKHYKWHTHLHKPITYKLFDDQVVIEGESIYTEFSWKFIESWNIKNDWLILEFNRFPVVFIPMFVVKKSGNENQIMELIEVKKKQKGNTDKLLKKMTKEEQKEHIAQILKQRKMYKN